MVWTYLRSCFSFDMRLWIGGVEKVYPARWYFCDPDALPFPDPHGCEASPWLKDWEVNEAWGEIGRKKGLDRGINPGYPGKCYIGQYDWFVNGQLPSDFFSINPCPPPDCCTYVPPVNPDPRCPPYIPCDAVPCTACLEGFGPPVYTVTATGGTGAFAEFNGIWTAENIFPCTWQHTYSTFHLEVGATLTGWVVFFDGGAFNFAAYNTVTRPACFAPSTEIPLVYQIGLGTPPTVTLS